VTAPLFQPRPGRKNLRVRDVMRDAIVLARHERIIRPTALVERGVSWPTASDAIRRLVLRGCLEQVGYGLFRPTFKPIGDDVARRA
jgi:hypothetical protein